jgi:hypothetical protein
MIYYNIHAAKILSYCNEGILRKHSGPNMEKWKKYLEWDKDLVGLASSAAEYCYINDPEPTHVSFGDIYCHASSPIRRYADLFNQRIIKSCIVNKSIIQDVDINWLNKRQKDCKRYERDNFFLQNLGSDYIHGIVLSEKKVWIKTWKRICTWKNDHPPGTKVNLTYFVNQNTRYWKDRIVFHLHSL